MFRDLVSTIPSSPRFLCKENLHMKRTTLFLTLAVLVSVFFGLDLASVRAQTASSGSVTGQVLDPQGAIVAADNGGMVSDDLTAPA